MTLLRQHVKEERVSLLIWSLVIGLLSVYIVLLWRMMEGTAVLADLEVMMQQLPEPIRAIIASQASLRTLNGWIQGIGFGQWLAIPLTVYTALLAAGILSREMDRRTIEFLLALPVSRAQVLLTRWGGMAIALAVLHLVHVLTLIVSVKAVGEVPSTGAYLLAELNSYLLYLALGSLFLLVSLFVDDYGRAVTVTLGAGFGLYFFHIASEGQTGVVEAVRGALPFAWYDPAAILMGGQTPWSDMVLLALLTGAALGLSVYLFQRKQITI